MRPDLPRFLRHTRRVRALARLSDAALFAVMMATFALAVARLLRVAPEGPSLVAAALTLLAFVRRPPTLADTAAWLDRRHGTDDLLASASLTRGSSTNSDERAWAAAVHASAAARVAALPPPGRVARFGVRAHACAIAAAAGLLLATRLLPTPGSADDPVARAAVAGAARPPAVIVADVAARRPDTADEAGRLPSSAEAEATAGHASPSRSSAGDAARGIGRADVARTPVPSPTANTAGASVRKIGVAGGGGGGPAATAGDTAAGGRVIADPHSHQASVAGGVVPPRALTGAAARVVPDAYRDLVHDFFDR